MAKLSFYYKQTGYDARITHSTIFLISSSFSLHSIFPSPTSSQNNTTGPFSRKTEEQHWLIHEAAGRILIRLWEITYALHTLLQEERWWAGRLRGHFVWLAIGLFLLISHLKTLGVFMYGENSLQQHLKAIQPARFGSKVKPPATKEAAMLSLCDAEWFSYIQILKQFLAALSLFHWS